MFDRVLELCSSAFDASHPVVTQAKASIGSTFLAGHRYVEAEKHLAQAFAIEQEVASAATIQTAASLAQVYMLTQQAPKAEVVYQRALTLGVPASQGWAHYSLATSLHAQQKPSSDNYTAAIEIYQKKGDILSEAICVLNWGGYLQLTTPTSSPRTAVLDTYNRAKRLCAQLTASKAPNAETANAVHGLIDLRLGRLYTDLQMFLEANSAFDKALGSLHRVYGDRSPEMATALMYFARYYVMKKDRLHADGMYRHLLSTLEKPVTAAQAQIRLEVLEEYAELLDTMTLKTAATLRRNEIITTQELLAKLPPSCTYDKIYLDLAFVPKLE
eukprot:TRINITY_DN2913_c0_g1_i2.p1 TRINITY_DN2913_c0_g1~~TRINITY_DN2913_c0_g1_i2.p1  ORF type:complete len:329 (-),score=70.38 TRINITY_DN2913_c0_g1_i2:71-1057(-)